MDLEGFPSVSGEMSPSEAQAIAERMAEVGEDAGPFAAWCSYNGHDMTQGDLDAFRDDYCGEYDSGEDYAQELAEESETLLTAWPYSCIDWKDAWHELEMGGGYWSEAAGNGNVWIFRSN